jgi:RND family efflux transporter MFP subunit
MVISLVGCGEKAKMVEPPPPEVIVSHPLARNVTKFMEFPGTTAALEFVQIRARVEGWLESMHFQPGSRVKTGDLLFVIDPRPFQAQVDLWEASLRGREAELQLKTANLRRAQQLLTSASISQLQFDIQNADEAVAIAQVGIAKADLEKAKLDLAYSRVTSPINGRVSRNYVDIGNLVGRGDKTLLTDVANDSSVYFYFEINERDLLMLLQRFPEMRRQVRSEKENPVVNLQLANETGFPHRGEIDFAESRVDPSTGTLSVRAVFPNEEGRLLAGLFGRVRVPIEEAEAMLLPELAVLIGQAGRFVLVVNKDNIVEQRPVKVGQREGTLRVIEEGISKDEWVVVNALQRARPGLRVKARESVISDDSGSPQKTSPSSEK